METLYYENPYQKDFTAEIINIFEIDTKYHVELDKTYFYPESEEHPGDVGFIDSIEVSSVYKKDNKIYHVVQKKPLKIHRVKCSIDWKRRYDYMQHHLGQHLISSFFSQLLNANTITAHFKNDYFYIDIDKNVENTEIKKVEEMVNKIIFDNVGVEILYPTKTELKKLSIKKVPLKASEKIRIVKISDIHVSPCDGLLPNSTIEVQSVKINKCIKRETGTRIEFTCGAKAISDYLLKYEWIERMANILSCDTTTVLCEVEKLAGELKKALAEKASLKNEVADYEIQNMLSVCENIENIRLVKCVYDNVDFKYANLLASKLVSFPNVIVLFGVKSGNKAQLIFMRSKDLNIINMNSLLKDSITLIDGKGGGSEFSAQGGGKNNNNLESSIAYACTKVKEYVLSIPKK